MDDQALAGVQSEETLKLWSQVKKMRAYVRYSSAEDCFRDYNDATSVRVGLENCWATLAQYERVLKDFGLSYEQVWMHPTLVLIIVCRPDQFITVRAHVGPPPSGMDIATVRLVTLCAALNSFFGPAQPQLFEQHLEAHARIAIQRANENAQE